MKAGLALVSEPRRHPTKSSALRRLVIAASMAVIVSLAIRSTRRNWANWNGPGSNISDPIHGRPLLGLAFDGYAVVDGKQVAVFNVTNHENGALHFQGCTVDIRSNSIWSTQPYKNNSYFPDQSPPTPEEANIWFTGENSFYPHRAGKIYFPVDELPDADSLRTSPNQAWRLRMMCARELRGFQLMPFKVKTARLTKDPRYLFQKNTRGFSYAVDILSEEIPPK